MVDCAYYVPNIPDNVSTTRYNHAIAIGEQASRSTLITYPSEPPDEVSKKYNKIHVLKDVNPISRSLKAAHYADSFINDDDGRYITTFHYSPAISGLISRNKWVLDIYDDPYQYIYRNPKSYHQITTRILSKILQQANRGIHTLHPATSSRFTSDQRFSVNGAPVEYVNPNHISKSSGGKLRCICANIKTEGKILLRAIKNADVNIRVDIYGNIVDEVSRQIDQLDLNDVVFIHGYQPHDVLLRAIEQAEIGFCLLPEKPDWYYSYPIKIGEYLAAGTIPVASSFPGIRQLTQDAGVLVEYDEDSITNTLEMLAANPDYRVQLKRQARKRAVKLDWRDNRRWFAKQALSGNRI